ncbi:MAG TPA: protein YgfX [Thiopseudomonas sp.]|nr:protein YgfX [Thiopseudomonas sp.]
MQNQSKQNFSCFWQPSLRLSQAVLCVLLLACVAVVLAAIPFVVKLVVIVLLSVQIYSQLRCMRDYQQPALRRGVRRDSAGWQLWSAEQGWRSIQLRADSMAIPALVLLRYRYPHQWFYRSALIPFDSAPQDSHRRLRVRLKFSRQRWQAVK